MRKIGQLSSAVRLAKVRNFWKKKYSKKTKKVEYKYRKEVAKKRLRIEGKFVTKE